MMEQSIWYYLQDGQQAGPVVKAQLLELFSNQTLAQDTMVWAEGMAQWQPACNVPGFFPMGDPMGEAAIAAGIPVGYQPVRPTSVTVLAILCIVIGGLSLMCKPLGMALEHLGNAQTQDMKIENSMPMQVYYTVFGCLSYLSAFVMVASGIGLLNLKNWARIMAYIYGWFSIVRIAIGMAMIFFVIAPQVQEAFQAQHEMNIMGFLVGGGMCVSVITLLLPIFLVIYMRKPHVIAACNK